GGPCSKPIPTSRPRLRSSRTSLACAGRARTCCCSPRSDRGPSSSCGRCTRSGSGGPCSAATRSRGSRRTARSPRASGCRPPISPTDVTSATSRSSRTTRARARGGLALLLAGLVVTAIAGAATLRQSRYAIEQELDGLRISTEEGSGLVTSVLEEIRAAEQYLGSPGDEPRREFQAAAEDA